MPVPNKYITTGENAIASYSFSDLAQGIGYLRVYPAVDSVGSGALLIDTTGSDSIMNVQTSTGTTSIDFELTFNKPFILANAPMVAVIPSGFSDGGVGGASSRTDAVFKKIDLAGAITILAQASGAIMAADTIAAKYNLLRKTIPRTNMKIGEKLRLTVTQTRITDDSGACKFVIGHDPLGRLLTNETTSAPFTFPTGSDSKATLDIPIKIDL